MRYQGKISNWKDDQGFGFITPNGGGREQVFVHINAFSNRKRRPLGNEIVTYELATDRKGRRRAENVAFVDERSAVVTSPGSRSAWLVLPVGFALGVVVLALIGRLPAKVLGLYLGASLLAFVTYTWDKSAAQGNRWRTRESTLHLIALLGGWPGALLAQKLLRHKSKKPSFQMVFWATVLFNCAALVWLLTAPGARVLRSVFGGLG